MKKGKFEHYKGRWREVAKEKNEDSAVIAYKISRDEVVDLLNDIQRKMELHDAEQAKEPHLWGYVATMNQAKQSLKDLLELTGWDK